MGKKRKYVNYMEISILFGAIIVIRYKNILVSGRKCYSREKRQTVLKVSGNVLLTSTVNN